MNTESIQQAIREEFRETMIKFIETTGSFQENRQDYHLATKILATAKLNHKEASFELKLYSFKAKEKAILLNIREYALKHFLEALQQQINEYTRKKLPKIEAEKLALIKERERLRNKLHFLYILGGDDQEEEIAAENDSSDDDFFN